MLNESNLQSVKEFDSKKDFFKIGVSVDCVIFGYEKGQLKVLLIKCNYKEFEGLWSLLGNMVKPDEDLQDASYRILKERTGLADVYLEQVQTFGAVRRHPSGRIITVAYYALIDIQKFKLSKTDNELHWHSVSDIDNLAFDHKEILSIAFQRLQIKIWEEPVAANLLPNKFSLRELQNVYQSILGNQLDRRNFRKKIALFDWLIDIDEMEQDVSHRPGKLYTFRKGV